MRLVHAYRFAAGWSREAATRWLATRGLNPEVEADGSGWRSVQTPAGAFHESTFATVSERAINAPDGVSAVMGDVRELAPDLVRFTDATLTRKAPGLALPNLDETDGADATFIASTAAVDSYGDIIEAEGIGLDHYLTNPVVLLNHHSDVPIGRTTSIGVVDGELRARVKFADATTPHFGPIAAGVRELISQGILSATSIGFMPAEYEPITGDDGEPTGGLRFSRTILKEISVVSVPANHEAVALARSLHIPEVVIRNLLDAPVQPTKRARARRGIELRQRALAASAHHGPSRPSDLTVNSSH